MTGVTFEAVNDHSSGPHDFTSYCWKVPGGFPLVFSKLPYLLFWWFFESILVSMCGHFLLSSCLDLDSCIWVFWSKPIQFGVLESLIRSNLPKWPSDVLQYFRLFSDLWHRCKIIRSVSVFHVFLNLLYIHVLILTGQLYTNLSCYALTRQLFFLKLL